MFKNYKLNLITMAVALFGFVGFANATQNAIPATTISENIGDWTEVHNANGIKVSFADYENFDGALCLKIKFENTTNQSVSASWSLMHKDSQTPVRTNTTEVGANASVVFIDTTSGIAIGVGETSSSYSIAIQ